MHTDNEYVQSFWILCRGKIRIAKDAPYIFILCLVLLAGVPAVWFGFEAKYLWRSVSPAPVLLVAYFYVNMLACMLVTTFRDPGILPRGLDPYPELDSPVQAPFGIEPPQVQHKNASYTLTRVDDGGAASLGLTTTIEGKWCTVCKLYRPPRCSHCRACNTCVYKLDHHCAFLNVCVGQRNYTTFCAMLCHMFCMCGTGVAGSIVHLYYLAAPSDPRAPSGFVHAVKTSPASIALFWIGTVCMIPVLCLATYHVWLVAHNRSTVEQIRLTDAGHLYDMQSSSGMHDRNVCVRMCMRFSARVRNLCVPADFATPSTEKTHHAREDVRKRTPFEHKSNARNALSVLGRPTAEHYVVWCEQRRA
ncbi:protein S-acyltransferase [Malassezia vespertilionis]|uniref:Palmitoyltransferase n=1 Tax=Malassezia vespertilionis TaxID=2020962 RepID=A0A2N1JH67_9BASI|nr:protein S-acyltransferase [Malassezia vespertilionis]PKI85901.1 Erf2p [Malassezia vespertilionis]WFD05216.1 protein S-acyltransferase [Malassezia vespertilionis]